MKKVFIVFLATSVPNQISNELIAYIALTKPGADKYVTDHPITGSEDLNIQQWYKIKELPLEKDLLWN